MKKLLVLMVLGFWWVGCTQVWNWIAHRNPTVVIRQAADPKTLPVHVTLAEVFLPPLEAVKITSLTDDVLYVPIRSKQATAREPVTILLETRDSHLLWAVESLRGEHDIKDELKVVNLMMKKTEVTGMVKDPIRITAEMKKDLHKEFPALEKEFVIVEEGEHPSLLFGAWALFLGSAIVVVFTAANRGKKAALAPPVLPPTIA